MNIKLSSANVKRFQKHFKEWEEFKEECAKEDGCRYRMRKLEASLIEKAVNKLIAQMSSKCNFFEEGE